MASIKNLKKDINFLTSELIDECLIYKMFHPKTDENKISSTIEKIVEKRNNLIYNVIHLKEKKESESVKNYYKSIYQEIEKELVSILDELSTSDK